MESNAASDGECKKKKATAGGGLAQVLLQN